MICCEPLLKNTLLWRRGLQLKVSPCDNIRRFTFCRIVQGLAWCRYNSIFDCPITSRPQYSSFTEHTVNVRMLRQHTYLMPHSSAGFKFERTCRLVHTIVWFLMKLYRQCFGWINVVLCVERSENILTDTSSDLNRVWQHSYDITNNQNSSENNCFIKILAKNRHKSIKALEISLLSLVLCIILSWFWMMLLKSSNLTFSRFDEVEILAHQVH